MNNTISNNSIYGGYVRKSSESEDRQVQSIERQKDDLISLIDKERLLLWGDIIEETKSAFSIGREGFNKLIKLTEKGEVNAWLCWHANRLSRNAMDSGIIIHLMDIGKLHHIRTPGKIYYNTPVDKMMLQIEFAMSKKDSDDKSEFVKSGLDKRYQKGFTSSKAPIGFLNDKTQEQGNRGWFVDTERFEKLKLLFFRFLKGNDSLNTITDYAREALSITTARSKRRGGNLVSRSTVENILKNPVYAGFFYSKDRKGDRSLRQLQKDLPRIITEDDHIKILNIFGDRYHSIRQRHTTLYTGHIFAEDGTRLIADVKLQLICDCGKKFAYRSKDSCPDCNTKIIKMKKPRYLSYTYYLNHQRKKVKGVSIKSIEQKKIDKFLLDFHKEELQLTEPFYLWSKKHLQEIQQQEAENTKQMANIYQKQLNSLEAKKKKLRKLFLDEVISYEEFKKDVENLEEQLELKRSQSNSSKNWYEKTDELLDKMFHFEDIIKKGNHDEKKQLLEALSSNLIWNEEKLLIHKANWLKIFIEGRKTMLHKYPEFEPKNNVIFKGLNDVLDTRCPVLWAWLNNIRKTLCN